MTEPAGPHLDAVLRRLADEAGLSFERGRGDQVRAGLVRAAARAGMPPDEYAARLAAREAPLEPLLDEVTVGETYFLRDPAQWQFVERVVLREAARRRGGVLRAWSAGCSTGEEPYTLAVLLVERGLGDRARVLATDVSEAALARARRAEYSLWALRGGADERLRRHLRAGDGKWTVAPEVARLVTFRRLNLAEPTYPSPELGLADLDLVLCRNVLIYLRRAVVAEVARRLFESLAPGGWLLTGASDPVLSRLAPFHVEPGEHGLAYQRPAETAAASPPARGARQVPAAAVPRTVRASRPSARRDPGVASPGRSGASHPPARSTPLDPACGSCRTLLDAGRFPEALSAIADAVARSPLRPELHLMRALVMTELGRLAEAEASARRALYLDRDAPFVHFFLAMIRLEAGDRAGAARGLEAAVELCARLDPGEELPLSSGLSAGALGEAARFQLEALRGARRRPEE